jgi:bifunctional UDP-N-acetylglucosamine pyrophosphorylase/glucosamine-1-phosphate N-acetyltransferase
MSNDLNAIILAAGMGSRMKSKHVKVVHEVAGKPIICFVTDLIKNLGVSSTYLVVGHQSDQVRKALGDREVTFVTQAAQLGTAHAVLQVAPYFGDSKGLDSHVIVLAGDCPLIQPETLSRMYETHCREGASATVLTMTLDLPGMYGRILRDTAGRMHSIKEAKECTPKELEIKEVNSGAYIFKSSLLFETLTQIETANTQGEFYLTDSIHLLRKRGYSIETCSVGSEREALGVNTRQDLAAINREIFDRNNLFHMQNGVTIIDPPSTFIGSDVVIGADTVVAPFSIISGITQVGMGCHLGAHCYLDNAVIDDHQTVMPYTILKG